MEFAAVYHKTSEQMSYPLNERELVINIKTGYDVQRVYLHHGDPFEAGILGGKEIWTGSREEIFYQKRLQHQLWWTTTLQPEFKRCKYYFELQTKEDTWFYFEDGFVTGEQMGLEGKMLQCFTVPWMNPADVNRTPDWVGETVWYQIFPDRFCKGDEYHRDECPHQIECPRRADITPWRLGPVTNEERFGGNLEGILEKIPYLNELGISGIYLNPIFEADSNHKYDTRSYETIDPAFGDKETFARLVRTAHEHGIRVMLDGVFNHCGAHFKPWEDVLLKGPESEYYDWFMIQSWPFDQTKWDTRDGSFFSFGFHGGMPKLNTNHEEVIRYFSDICTYWVGQYDVDGIRFDVGNEVSHKFLKCIRSRLKAINPDIYLLGEIWHDGSQWLLGDEYDSVMNYPLTAAIQDFFLDQTLDKQDFECMINRCYTMYMQQNNRVLFNLLDSHDTDRLRNRAGDEDVFFQQLAVLFTMPGSPCIYYGTEIAMEGGHDPDCRRCMPWEELEQPVYRERIGEIKRLIALRRSEPGLRGPHFHFPNKQGSGRLVEYIRLDQAGGRIEVLLNCTGVSQPAAGCAEVLYSRRYEQGMLLEKGILIRRLTEDGNEQ